MDFGLIADQTCVTHLQVQLIVPITCTSLKILREDSYRQAVKEIHQNDHDQEHKGEEEDVAEGRVEGDVGELELSNEHGEGLDQAETKVVEEGIFSISAAVIFMEEDVEAKSEGKEEKRIPDEEGGKGFEDPIEHGGVDVVGRKPRMPTHHRHQLDPEKEELKKELFQNKVCFLTTR